MKHILLVFIVSLISINCQAQNIASSIQLQDGTIVNCSHVFVDGEIPTFYSENGLCENIFWSFSVYDENGEKNICIKSEKGTDRFTFKIEPNLFPCFDYINDSQKIEYPNDPSLYIRCSVDLHQDNITIDSVPIILNILPSRPKIKKASILGNFDFKLGGYNSSAELTILFYSERMSKCRFLSYVADSLYSFQFPESYTGVYYDVDIKEKSKNSYEFKYDYADWGEFYTIAAYNKYGSVLGDTLFTNSIIEDPEIIKFLEKMYNRVTIDEIQNDNLQISLKNNILTIEGLSNKQILYEIYSVNGRLINRRFSTKTIDLNNLCSGIYIIKIKLGEKTIIKEIFKK